MAAAPKEHNEVAALENWRILIKKEEASAAKWEDWWGWMVKTNPAAAADEEEAKQEFFGNTKSMINAHEIEVPGFASKDFLKAHYGSMTPHDKFVTPQLESHKVGWRAVRKPLENPSLAPRHGRVNARLDTNDPL
jgi:hypothetical protein